MKKIFTLATLIACLALMTTTVFAESSVTRIKDIAKVQGMRNNQLIGYGLVVGLPGTGDSDKIRQTINSTVSMLKSFGITVDTSNWKAKNVAAVMVTATLPPFVREGDTIDVVVGSMGDADSVQGGVLLQTPLIAANGEVYAVAQGSVSTGGFVAGKSNNRAQKNFPSAGNIPNGAIVERTLEDDLGRNGQISLSLSSSDFTTASRITNAINSAYGGNVAHAANPGRVDINIPGYYRSNVVEFIATIEELPVVPDTIAKVVVSERTGTIVMGGNVSVDECAITQGGLSIRIQREESVSQPDPYSYGTSLVVRNAEANAKEEMSSSVVLPATTKVSDVIGALNAVGASPRDCISILQAMKAAGAIHAVLEII